MHKALIERCVVRDDELRTSHESGNSILVQALVLNTTLGNPVHFLGRDGNGAGGLTLAAVVLLDADDLP